MFDHLLVLPIVELHIGAAFDTDLPTHCTVMPWFSLPEGTDTLDLYAAFKILADEMDPIEIHAESTTLFRDGRHPVSLLRQDKPLMQLHDSILDFLRQMECALICPDWIGRGYRPHVSTDGCRLFPPGASHTADRFVLIRKNGDGLKRVIEKYMFH